MAAANPLGLQGPAALEEFAGVLDEFHATHSHSLRAYEVRMGSLRCLLSWLYCSVGCTGGRGLEQFISGSQGGAAS